jgi:hypothetical protein
MGHSFIFDIFSDADFLLDGQISNSIHRSEARLLRYQAQRPTLRCPPFLLQTLPVSPRWSPVIALVGQAATLAPRGTGLHPQRLFPR